MSSSTATAWTAAGRRHADDIEIPSAMQRRSPGAASPSGLTAEAEARSVLRDGLQLDRPGRGPRAAETDQPRQGRLEQLGHGDLQGCCCRQSGDIPPHNPRSLYSNYID